MHNIPFIGGGPDDGSFIAPGPSGILPEHWMRNFRRCFKTEGGKFGGEAIVTSISLDEQHVYKYKGRSYVYLGILPIGKGEKK